MDYRDIEQFALEMNRDHSVIFEIASKYWFGWTPGTGDGQGGLACCVSWGRKESDTTERLN